MWDRLTRKWRCLYVAKVAGAAEDRRDPRRTFRGDVKVERLPAERKARDLDAKTSFNESPQWMDGALCTRSSHPEWWFPVDAYATTTVTAKAICSRCGVQEDCLEYAIANRIEEGIWGGES